MQELAFPAAGGTAAGMIMTNPYKASATDASLGFKSLNNACCMSDEIQVQHLYTHYHGIIMATGSMYLHMCTMRGQL